LSLGAKDIAKTFLFSKYAPQLATCVVYRVIIPTIERPTEN
jgi:hypothetical protein